MGWVSALLLLTVVGEVWTCIQFMESGKKRQSELCRLQLVSAIVYGKVVAINKNPHKESNKVAPKDPIVNATGDLDLVAIPSKETYSAVVEPLCDVHRRHWFNWQMPTGSFQLTGLGDFDCHSYTVVENNTYFFLIRVGGGRYLVPDGSRDENPIFPDTPENRKMFFSHFQFSNCDFGTNQTYPTEWELQEHIRNVCSRVQKALHEVEDLERLLENKVKSLEKSINHLREKVKGTKRSLRQVKKESKREAMIMKQQQNM
ncbi:coiled-coil domain-containing protein 3-like [Leucoraja erinacea]|uniref:coiled-coil domain-containing protein 3-like n=1 Tax=Leucoraja erinaceus TaxID=7782 RepID=UPI002455E8C5|nr:coiled-coil domain-containing protein 3-like [Leucoraja erinacea]